ncbi:MAG: hypothetical protein IJZ16_07015 [Clostridia bacterium]|nr:hypothetical protein [Clostridia bacterium]
MRDIKRDQQTVWYSLRNVVTDKDEWGNTVDIKDYGKQISDKFNVSANKGTISAQAFGTELNYDREMSTHNMNCPIDEYTRLWLDGRKVTEPHNYVVVAVSKSLNCIRYAIRRVDVS